MHASNSRLGRRMIRLLLLFGSLVVSASAISCSAAEPDTSPVARIDDAAHLALSANARERQEGMQWLLRNGDRTSVAVLIQLLRWLPDEEGFVAARLETLTGAHVGSRWFDWMIWQQGHPEFVPYPGYTGFLADLFAGVIRDSAASCAPTCLTRYARRRSSGAAWPSTAFRRSTIRP
jgi:hypothetical protein